MSQFQVQEAENVGRNTRSRKTVLAPANPNCGGKTRARLQPLNNSVTQNVKRIKLTKVAGLEKEVRLDKSPEENSESPKFPDFDAVQLKNSGETPRVDVPATLPKSLLYVWEYKHDIWQYLRELELTHPSPKPKYMIKQADLSWEARSIVVDWLASVADAYSMSNETLHLSVNYVDRVLSNVAVVRRKFQLVAAAAMLLAGKMEEIYPIDVKEWVHLTADSYTSRQVLKMEQLIARMLRFKMQPPTMLNFIQHFCNEHNLDSKTLSLAMYISELVLLEGDDYLNQKPSKLAAASIALARHTLKEEPWPKKFKEHCGYSLRQLSPIVARQHQTLIDSPRKEQQEIQTKYKKDKYHRVALVKPRKLVMETLGDEED